MKPKSFSDNHIRLNNIFGLLRQKSDCPKISKCPKFLSQQGIEIFFLPNHERDYDNDGVNGFFTLGNEKVVKSPILWKLHRPPVSSKTPKNAQHLSHNSLQTHFSTYLEAWFFPSMSKSENIRQYMLNWLNCCWVISTILWFDLKMAFPVRLFRYSHSLFFISTGSIPNRKIWLERFRFMGSALDNVWRIFAIDFRWKIWYSEHS